jgi:hypothetical protein
MKSRLTRWVVIMGVTVIGSAVAMAAPASAAQPVVQACVGTTFSAGAHATTPFGPVIVGFAQDPTSRPGLGDGIQQLQAGQVPDEVAVNTCHG